MSDEQKPGDPADKAADGAFGGVQSHRAGYGDDKLARLIDWLRAHPTATLASGEGALLLAENDRLHRILDALREPSESIMHTAYLASFQHTLFERAWTATLCAAVTAAELEVGP